MKFRLSPITAAVALLSMPVSTLAQTAPPATPASAPAAKAEVPTQTVEITGIRASLQQAINVKRLADANIDVVTAEDIGKMPDKNVADSLSRIAGISVITSAAAGSGGFDERDRVGLRGTNPSLTQTLVDGHAIANGDWFVLDQTGAGVGRSVSYTLLPSELVSRVEVHKSAEASQIEGGTAGSINIITRTPLEFRKNLTFEASLGMVYSDLAGESDPQASALLNFRNNERTFGLMVQAFSEKRSLRRDGVETLGFFNRLDSSNAPNLVAAHPELAGVYLPDLIGSALFEQTRERKGGLVKAQFRPTKDIDLVLTGFSSKLGAENYNRNYLMAVRPGLINSATLSNYEITTGKNGDRTLTGGTFNWANASTAGYYDMISRDASAESSFFNLEGTFKLSNALTLSSNIGTTKGKGKTLSQDVVELAIRTDRAGFAINGPHSAPAFSFNNPSMTADWIFGTQNVVVHDKEDWAQLDAEYKLDTGMLRSLKFGARSATHKRHTDPTVNQGPGCASGTPYRVTGFDWSQPSACAVNGVDAPQNSPFAAASLPALSASYPSNFGSGLGSGFPTQIGYIPADALAAYNASFANRDPIARRSPFDGGEYSVKESTTAVYVQANLEGDAWGGNVGVRLVRTKQTSGSFRPSRDGETPDVSSLFGNFNATSDSRTYTDVLPSASVRLDITKDVVGRMSVSRTMTRADYTALSAYTSLNTNGMFLDNAAVGGGTAGNPGLKPVRSTNIDANISWYFAPRAYASVGAFHMDLASYITNGSFTATYPVLLGNTGGGGDVQLVDRQFVITGLTNKKATVSGMEFAFETPIGNNFGVGANYTLSNGSDEDGKLLRGNVKNAVNLTGYYENDVFSARVNYNHMDDIFLGLDRGTEYFQKGVGVLSASLGYKFNANFGITLDMQNLNNPTLVNYASDVQPRAIYKNGRQYYLTARVKF
ncbi:TonB-dependent receptor [Ideonella sp. 4Y16]|uniref:TonB-dependent receptor n=2 Tax=Ideonella aquatica TaxID=2824119 RepID=A0A941BRH1_9BURK|nr:TonB-dependent receptor [Ideonella alba]MBQ0946186.1 TonB-dependent receptor [Ideonella alba]MBQ0960390.1 TonB-dependent receptor [Ideonella aquatica]